MKKLMILSAATLMFAACANEELIDKSVGDNGKDGPISFVMAQKNMTRAYTDMQKTGHYNFGVFAYKETDKVNAVMPNYLVGYYDETNAYQKAGTTWGDQEGVADGLSYWMYEGMGSAEYNGTYAGGALTPAYTSNNANQYLKYWDNSSAYTCFYAYAPYINGGAGVTASYVDGTAQSATGADTYVLTIPNGSLKDGYDDASLSEYMYASAKVLKADYGHDVALQFKRLNAKVNIKFWEDVPGWNVRILNLSDTYNKGVYAAASINDGTSGQYGYKAGKYYTSNGARIQFSDGSATGTKQFYGTTADNNTQLIFAAPTDAQIGENRFAASASATTYYAIPKGADSDADGTADQVMDNGSNSITSATAADADLIETGFTFHVTYELTAKDTGEKIVVKNATVHVPNTYCNWKENTHYTYIFKITTNSNGTTDGNPTIDPKDPEVPTVASLYPIVFDNCTVVDWEENESEWEITEGVTGPAYHNITLTEGGVGMYSFKSNVAHTLDVAITDADTYLTHAVDYTKVTVTGPSAVTYDSDAKTITVPAGAAKGLYTVTYTCPAPTAAHVSHPATFTQTFFVGNDYAVALNLYKVATNALAGTKLDITLTKDGGTAPDPTAEELYIEYPNHVTPTDKVTVDIANKQVVIAQDAEPGVYKIVYKVKEGDKQVKVDEKLFEVINWQHSLSKKVVFLNNGGSLEVTKSGVDDAITLDASVASAGKITISGTTINVANDCPEGTYNVYYTVNRTDATSLATYLKSFEVKNTYKVTLSTSAIDYNKDWDGGASTYGSEYITVTPWVNGVAKTTGTSTLAVKQGATDKTSLFTLTDNGNGTYKLQVKPQTAVAGKYTVEFTENGVTSKVDFVVTH